jgi:1-acyl-sn-glycerol-3-phosphate acyltransferase
MDTDYILHRILRRIASWAVYSFFTEVRVIGGEKVPMNGPIIVYVVPGCLDLTLMARFRTATHHNMMLDPAILCSSSFSVVITFADVKQLRRFLTVEYYTWTKHRNSPVHG